MSNTNKKENLEKKMGLESFGDFPQKQKWERKNLSFLSSPLIEMILMEFKSTELIKNQRQISNRDIVMDALIHYAKEKNMDVEEMERKAREKYEFK